MSQKITPGSALSLAEAISFFHSSLARTFFLVLTLSFSNLASKSLSSSTARINSSVTLTDIFAYLTFDLAESFFTLIKSRTSGWSTPIVIIRAPLLPA